MGAVYRGVDTQLGRPVAIKFLRPEFAAEPARRDRFLREARAAAAITHPNVCTIYEVDQVDDEMYLVMQLISGKTLSHELSAGPLEPGRVLAIARQLADALATAHASGVVHGDLKPSNIMLRNHDEVTVLDFGLASVLFDCREQGDISTMSDGLAASPPVTSGTLGYMAPELIRGASMSPSSDVFALGVTLYETATGRCPFRGADAFRTIAATLDTEPPSLQSVIPGFPPWLDECLLRCLNKSPEHRFPDGRVLADALQGRPASPGGSAAVPRRAYRSLAILPTVPQEGGALDGYVGEAIASELITKLASLKHVLVTSRSATVQFSATSQPPRDVGRELGVEAILEVSTVKHEAGYRIDARLLDVDTGYYVWADRSEGAADELLMLQDKVAGRVARALRARFLREPASDRPKRDVATEAYRYYLKARALHYRFNEQDNLLAIDGFRRALAVDPGFAKAHAGVASAYLARMERGWDQDDIKWTEEALEACDRAVAIDPWLSEAYSARGSLRLRQGHRVDAEADFTRALAINPNDETAHGMLGLVRFERGDLDGAARSYRRALRIRPGHVWCWNDLGWVMWLAGDFAETERALAKVLTINPADEVARVGVATGHYFRGELAEAEAVARASIDINPNHPFPRPVLAVAIARQGRVEEAKAICADVLRQRPADFLTRAALSVVHAIAGDEENLRRASAAALAVPALRVPLNVNVAVHFAFLGRDDCVGPWLDKARKEGMDTSALLRSNPLLNGAGRQHVRAR